MRELIATPAFLVFVLCTWPAVAAFHTHSGDIVADTLAWYAIGAYFVFQSGQPWEAWDYHAYQPLTGTSTSDTIRIGCVSPADPSRCLATAEHAGDRRTPSHHQLDLNYTQNFPLRYGTNLQLRADIFNVYNRRTGYNPQPSVNSSTFGQYLNAFDPRRFQLALNVQF